jgi:para-nitrobenzyl esterase
MTARAWLAAVGILACGPALAAEVEVDGETLVGELLGDSGIAAFRGIPFAEPPVGELRWQAPQPLNTKLERRDARQFRPACMQKMRILDWYRDMAEIFGSTRDEFADLEISEDCLYLNIWTPKLDEQANLPVMVYVHGGSNNSGWAYEPDYHGHVLAERGVVLVSIAYRLGVFGFFSHPDIDGDALANFGLWDQVAALEWVQQNIAKFGGDPTRVTVFGESAGSQDVLALMASPVAEGLFSGAILQSNAGFGLGRRSSPALVDERQRGLDTARLFDFDGGDSLARLKAVPAHELLEKYDEHFWSYYHSPAIDGQLITRSIWDIVTSGELADIPFIIGSTADERYAGTPVDADDEDVAAAIAATDWLDSPETLTAVADETDYRERIDRITTADNRLCPSQYLAARYDNAYVYYFSRVRDGEGGSNVRAYHGAELPYTFGTHPDWMTTTEVDRKLTEQMLGYWTTFAATGNPNTEGLPEWPTFSEADRRVMEFGNTAIVEDAQEPVLCRIFWQAVSGLNRTTN